MAVPRTGHAATLLPDGKVLVTGGAGALLNAELYDPTTGQWTVTSPMVQARTRHTATLLANGKVLIAGGGFGNTALSSAELYDSANGIFTATGSMAIARATHTATLLSDGKVLVTGGDEGVTKAAELYDPLTGIWSLGNDLAKRRFGHTATRLTNGKVLIAGGTLDGVALEELYDPSTGSFTPVTVPHVKIESGSSAALLPDGSVLITGGNKALPYKTAQVYVFTAQGGVVTSTDDMTTTRAHHTATTLPNGKVLIAGGYGGCSPVYSQGTAELYDPSTGKFVPLANMVLRRAEHTATLLLDGRVLLVGGIGSSLPAQCKGGVSIPEAELFDPNAM